MSAVSNEESVELLQMQDGMKPTESTSKVLPRAKGKTTSWSNNDRWTGWNFGLRAGVLLVAVALLLNISMIIAILALYGVDSNGKTSMLTASCRAAENYSTAFHLLINVLSTLIIGAGNYAMQGLSAPSRQDLDRAHAANTWLDIGIPSWRNLGWISKPRLWLWILIATTSIPLHLFYNSAFFVTYNQHLLQIYSVKPSFLRPDGLAAYPKNATEYNSYDCYDGTVSCAADVQHPTYNAAVAYHDSVLNGSLIAVQNTDCINRLMERVNTKYHAILLVTTNGTIDDPPDMDVIVEEDNEYDYRQGAFPGGAGQFSVDPRDWICKYINPEPYDTHCTQYMDQILANATGWAPFEQVVDHCLLMPDQSECAFEFSVPIMAVVIVMNIAKLFLLIFVARLLRRPPLITFGDAIVSFLCDPPDPTSVPLELRGTAVSGLQAPKHRCRSYEATSKRRRIMAALLLGLWIAFVIVWLIYASVKESDFGGILSLPIGVVDPLTIIYEWNVASSGVSGVFQNAIIANLGQLILSMIYFSFNGICTLMASAIEWSSYAIEKKGLRVSSSPQGCQRSTYFLQLPYAYAVPLTILSILLHWMLSQSIFVVSIMNDPGGYSIMGIHKSDQSEKPYGVTCAYSPKALCILIGMVLALGLYTAGIGLIPLQSRIMPVVGSNSRAIAQESWVEDASLGHEEATSELQWRLIESHGDMPRSERYGFSSGRAK